MADGPSLGWFQSLLQLAVGTNITFTVIFSLFDNAIEKEKKYADELLSTANSLMEACASRGNIPGPVANAVERSKELHRSVHRLAENLENFTYNRFRWIALFCAGLALYLLVNSSFRNDQHINLIEVGVTIISLTPFILFSIVTVTVSTIKSRQIARDRNDLDDLMQQYVPTN